MKTLKTRRRSATVAAWSARYRKNAYKINLRLLVMFTVCAHVVFQRTRRESGRITSLALLARHFFYAI